MATFVALQIVTIGGRDDAVAETYYVPQDIHLPESFLVAFTACSKTSQLRSVAMLAELANDPRVLKRIVTSTNAPQQACMADFMTVTRSYTAFLRCDMHDDDTIEFSVSLAGKNKTMLFYVSQAAILQTEASALLEMSTLARFKGVESLVLLCHRDLPWDPQDSPRTFVQMFPALRDVHVLTPSFVDPAFFKLPAGSKWRTITYTVDNHVALPLFPRNVAETLVLTLPANINSWTWAVYDDDAARAPRLKSLAGASDKVLIASDRITDAFLADPKFVRLTDTTPLWTGQGASREDTVRAPLVWGFNEGRDDAREVLLPNGARVPQLPDDTLNMLGVLLHKHA